MRRKNQKWSPALPDVVERATSQKINSVLAIVRNLERAKVVALADEMGINLDCPKTRAMLNVLVSEGIVQLARGSVTLSELQANPPSRDIPEPVFQVLDLREPKKRLVRTPLGRTAFTAR